jgi:hypothetical protein
MTETVTIEKQVWESTLHRSMVLQAENENLEKEKAQLTEQLIQAKQSMSQALNYLACMDRISDTEPNEQLAFDVLRKCLEELENA